MNLRDMNKINIRTRFNKYNDGLLSKMKDKVYNNMYDNIECKINIIVAWKFYYIVYGASSNE